jgi:hypothetical protein
LRSKSRKRVIVEKRYIFFCFAYYYINVNIESITDYFDKNHANVYSAIDACKNEYTIQPKYYRFVKYMSTIYKLNKVFRDSRRKPYKYKERPSKKRHNCMVDMFYTNGIFVQSFRTVKEASKEMNISANWIYRSCNHNKSCGKYKFRYQ